MRERTANLAPWEVLAALRAAEAGRTWQLRRAVKPQPQESFAIDYGIGGAIRERRAYGWTWLAPRNFGYVSPDQMIRFCPFGAPGDVLVLREAWWQPPVHTSLRALRDVFDATCSHDDRAFWRERGWRRRSPLTMRATDARLRLPVVEVRCEQVQKATEADAIEMGAWDDYTANRDFAKAMGCSWSNMPTLRDALQVLDLEAWERNDYQWVVRGVPVLGSNDKTSNRRNPR